MSLPAAASFFKNSSNPGDKPMNTRLLSTTNTLPEAVDLVIQPSASSAYKVPLIAGGIQVFLVFSEDTPLAIYSSSGRGHECRQYGDDGNERNLSFKGVRSQEEDNEYSRDLEAYGELAEIVGLSLWVEPLSVLVLQPAPHIPIQCVVGRPSHE